MRYKATKTGTKFHHSDRIVRGLMGPVGNGKTVACILELVRLSKLQLPNWEGRRLSKAIIIRNTSPELRTTTLKSFQDWIPKEHCDIKLNPIITGVYRITLPDGTWVEMELVFLAMDRPDDTNKLRGIESTYMLLNEASQLPYEVLRKARERIGRYPAPINGYQDKTFDKGSKVPEWLLKAHKDKKSPLHELTHKTKSGIYSYIGKKRLLEDGSVDTDDFGDNIYEPVTRKAVLMDTNPPDDEHWWYHLDQNGHLPSSKSKKLDIGRTREVFDFFSAPSALIKLDDGTYKRNPDAENIANLMGGFQYYEDMLAGNTQEYINVMVGGMYGALFTGKPVYGEYNDTTHCPIDGVAPVEGVPICLGWDFGHTPAVCVAQLIEGQMRVVAEIWSDSSNTKKFARDFVKPFLHKYFPGYLIGFSMADPAGNSGGEGEGKSSIGILNDEFLLKDEATGYKEPPLDMGFTTVAAPTNDPTLRINAVESFMLSMRSGEPCYMVDKSCTRLRKAKQGGYHYKKVQNNEGVWKEKPNKNHYSHISDAEQYVALGFVNNHVVDYYHSSEYDDHDDNSKTPNVLGW